MGMLDTIVCLNIRHELPRIGIRQQQAATERAPFRPAEMHRNYKAPLADVAATQVTIDIDTYESRKTYGFLNHADFARKYGGEGSADIAANTSAKTQSAWAFVMSGGQSGHDEIVAQAKSELRSQTVKWPTWQATLPPAAKITVHPSEIVGQVDPGSDKMDIQTTAWADVKNRPGHAETYMATKGFVRQWTTVGHYDIYA